MKRPPVTRICRRCSASRWIGSRLINRPFATSAAWRARRGSRSIIYIGHARGLQVLAEGVEDEATADLLRDVDCGHAQGYLFAKPCRRRSLRHGWFGSRTPMGRRDSRPLKSGGVAQTSGRVS